MAYSLSSLITAEHVVTGGLCQRDDIGDATIPFNNQYWVEKLPRIGDLTRNEAHDVREQIMKHPSEAVLSILIFSYEKGSSYEHKGELEYGVFVVLINAIKVKPELKSLLAQSENGYVKKAMALID